MWSGLGAVGLTFSLFVSLMFLLQVSEIYSRGTFFLQLITVAISVLTLRAISHTRIQSGIAGGRIEARRTVLIGNSAHCEPISEQLHNSGVRTLRRLPLPATAGKPASEADANSEANAVRRTVEICRKFQPDDILILATTGDLPVITRLAGGLSQLPVTLHMIPMDARDLLGSFSVGELGNLATVQLLGPPLSTFDIVVKRAFDILTACMGIVLFSPLFLIVAAAIKLDSPGPVLFRQTRHGYNNDTIRVLKFRSMRAMAAGEPFEQATRNDPRVTRLGRILRRTNIDEVPQLFNVLTGEMSIVGPRPHPIALNERFERYISPFRSRHKLKPGITGWAQVNGYRGETNSLEKMQRRVECDLYYIDNWSFLLDIKIILMTLFSKQSYMNGY